MTDMANKFYYCAKLSLKLQNFRLKITYFGTLRMHQIGPFLSFFFFKVSMPPGPLAQVRINIITGLTTRLVCRSLTRLLDVFIKTLLNAV